MISLSIVLADGTTLQFSDASARDAGDYVGEFVHQKCSVQTNGLWRVFFRPDADGSRDEVVVEYGSAVTGPVVHVLTPYAATVSRDGVQVYQTTIPRHFWSARWRWQSAPRPVVRDPATLRARGWIPNFGPVGLYRKPPVTTSLQWPGPMATMTGIDPGMGVGGDHDQIGHLTEAAADYMIRPSPITLASLRAEGEWMGNACMHWRNDDGTMFDVIAQQLRRINDGSTGGTLLWISPPASTPGAVYLEYAHMYPCENAGWMLTDDPYLLEELQFVVQWQLVQNAWLKKWGQLSFGQERALAWELRDAFLAAATSPVTPPSWLLPQSFFKAALSATLAHVMDYVNAPARIHSYFRCIPRTDISDAWMGGFLKAAVGVGVGMGFAEWKPVFDWMIPQTIAQTNGTSGWNRQVPAPYEWYPNLTTIPFGELQPATYDTNTCADWAGCWAYMKGGAIPTDKPWADTAQTKPNYRNTNSIDGVIAEGPIDDSAWDGHTIMGGITGMGTSHVGHVRAALAQAVTLGHAEAQPCYDYLNAEFPIYLKKRLSFGQARFSIDPLSAAAPATTTTSTGGPTVDLNTLLADLQTAQTDATALNESAIVAGLNPLIASVQAQLSPPPTPTGALSNLASGCIRAIGPWADTLGHFHRSDYSTIVADPANSRILFYGGGHAPALGDGTDDDIRSLDMNALTWSSLYAPTPTSDMTTANEDVANGRWISTNNPIVRHDYNSSVVQGGRYYLFTCNWQLLGPINPAPISWYDFESGKWSYSASGSSPGWLYTAAAAFDPVSGLFVIVGTDIQSSGWLHLWTYNAQTDAVTKVKDLNVAGHLADMHYDAASDSFLLFQGGGVVSRLTYNRSTPTSSALVSVATTGVAVPNPNNAPISFAFDGKRYGGSVIAGLMYVFDPATAAWSSVQINNEDGSSSAVNQVYYCIEFDSTTGCYVILGADWQTYAYRPQ